MALFATFITTPLVMAVYKPARRAKMADYKYRTVESRSSNTELRILACFHGWRNISSIINLLEVSRGVQKSDGLSVYAMHLTELSERSSAILMVHKARKNGLPFRNRGQKLGSNLVVVAFDVFQQLSRVSVRPMTAISSMSDMHEDICTTAERKRAAIIILPLHKQQILDGSLETTRTDFQLVNRRVLEQAPCSVGILVDRGLGGTTQVSASNVSYVITVIFFGGCDDREALAYGARMAEHPGVSLKVIHFLVKPEALGEIVRVHMDDETINAVHEVRHCNLFLVGRLPEGEVALALSSSSDCPELGPVGGLLASSDFSTTAAVLVVQQYNSQVSLDLALQNGNEFLGKDSESN
ncbi:hypothetical protein H0E87_006567 [Populus deltoides]|uniref:Uncharacterized protein n=1 Tax=Populus deltoides TaxID=3696 RepID=A0A8T2Z7I2_POPDE|nr:hypothetical protein H0E87_006567 [Populus deltoides]